MSEFNNATIARKANFYFDGQVTSRTVTLENGERVTLGIMMPGEYRFDTAARELMEIQAGRVEVLLPGESEWRSVGADEDFKVPANAEFDIKVLEVTDYCCSYFTDQE